MGELLSYSIVSGLAMLALYLVYRILLARDINTISTGQYFY